MSLPAGAVNGLAPALDTGPGGFSLAPLPPAGVFALDPPPQALRAVAAASARAHAASLSDWDSHRSRCPTIREDPLRKDGTRQAPLGSGVRRDVRDAAPRPAREARDALYRQPRQSTSPMLQVE